MQSWRILKKIRQGRFQNGIWEIFFLLMDVYAQETSTLGNDEFIYDIYANKLIACTLTEEHPGTARNILNTCVLTPISINLP